MKALILQGCRGDLSGRDVHAPAGQNAFGLKRSAAALCLVSDLARGFLCRQSLMMSGGARGNATTGRSSRSPVRQRVLAARPMAAS